MGIVRGLKSINAHIDAEEAKYNGDGEGAKWLKLTDKQTVKVLFLQELDPDSPNFSPKNDLGFLAVEHSNPKNFRRKAVCTIDDEGACYGCEQHKKNYKAGWKQKTRLYINALIDDGSGERYVAVVSQGNGPKSITQTLIEYASDEDDPSITNKWFKIKRTGSGQTDTSYSLMSGAPSKENVEEFELYDLDKVLRQVPYADQEAHYLGGEEPAKEEEATKEPDSDEWV